MLARHALLVALTIAVPALAGAAVVQIDVRSVLDVDVIVNLGPAGIDRTQDPVDDGLAGGDYCPLTQSAAVFRNPGNPDGLPDDARFAGTALHPEVVLAYRNDDDGPNAHRLVDAGDAVTFPVVPDFYRELHVFVLTGSGSSTMVATLTYDDTTTSVSAPVTVPDWFDDPVDTPALYRLIDGMDRVQSDGVGSYEDFDDPAMFGVRYLPDPARRLASVRLERTSGTLAVLTFFGATGVSTGGGTGPTVYESPDRARVVDPAYAVGTATTAPFDYAPAPGSPLFYAIDDGSGSPPLIRIVKGGRGIQIYF